MSPTLGFSLANRQMSSRHGDFGSSKALDRFSIVLEFFTLHPGAIETDVGKLSMDAGHHDITFTLPSRTKVHKDHHLETNLAIKKPPLIKPALFINRGCAFVG